MQYVISPDILIFVVVAELPAGELGRLEEISELVQSCLSSPLR